MNIKFLQNENGNEWDVEDTIRIETTVTRLPPFSDTESLFDPSSIEITITGYNSNVVVNSQSMIKEEKGKYYYNWDTTGLDSGDYEIDITATSNGSTEKDDEWIKLTD